MRAPRRTASRSAETRDPPEGPGSAVHHRASRRHPPGRLAMWAADCAEHVLHHFEQARPKDDRPRRAIDLGRAWARGEISWAEVRTAAGHANAAARDLRGAPRHAAYAAGQAAAVGHVAAHELGLRPTRSGRRRRQRLTTSARRPATRSAGGSARNSLTRSENSCSTTSGCATSCAGSSSTAGAAA